MRESNPVMPTIVVHGGAGRVAEDNHEAAVAGVEAAARAGHAALLEHGCEAAVVAAVRVLEDLENFNAGRGACMTEEGTFEVDAGIMRSRDLRSGAVASVRDLADPITVAREIMEHSRHCLLVGEGAHAFARARGVGRFDRSALWTAKAQDRFDEAVASGGGRGVVGQADTVGAVAIDGQGYLCAGGSTGGVLLKARGRVGDCPLIGPGFFASPTLGAACATGVGEAIMTHVASFAALQLAAAGTPANEAAARLCERVSTVLVAGQPASCGIIMITAAGEVGVAHQSPHMSWAVARGEAAAPALEAGLRRGRP
ncbi:MAG: isoaspartyl peptidase/L-asparaginase [Nannocystaceae bacterium]